MSFFRCCSSAAVEKPIPIAQLTNPSDRKKAALHYLRTHPGVDNNKSLKEFDWNCKMSAAVYMLCPLCIPFSCLCMRYKSNSKVSRVINRAAEQGVMVDVNQHRRYVGINFEVVAAPMARLARGQFETSEIIALGRERYEV